MVPLSYQLYSARMFPPIEDTLHMLSDIGYAHVEGYGALLEDAEAVAALDRGLQETGLTMPSCHMGLAMCESAPDTVVQLAQRRGLGIACRTGPAAHDPFVRHLFDKADALACHVLFAARGLSVG